MLFKNYRIAQKQLAKDQQAYQDVSKTAKALPFEFDQILRMTSESHAQARVYFKLLMDGMLPYQTLADIIAAQRSGSKVQQSAGGYVEAWLMYALKNSEKQRKRYAELFPSNGKSMSIPNFDAALSTGGKLALWNPQYIKDLAREAAEMAYSGLVMPTSLAQRNRAMMSNNVKNGGIDFDWQAAGFKVSGSGIDQAMMTGMSVDVADVQGLVPVIIKMTPMMNVDGIFQ